ncbi:MAG: MFS transporter [Bacteroidota bacterium]|nr:MFS transporter [Bacteroidota bacterium]MDP3145284.1 MFS transporter [Bacteroidota bacterium]
MKRSDIILLLTLAFVQFTGIVDFMILMPLKPKLTELWGISPSQFGVAVFAYGIGAFISSLICVNKVDKFDRKKVLVFIYAGFTLGTFFCGFATSYIMLVVARFITGLFGGVSGSIIQSIVGDAIPVQKRGQAMGILMMGFALASIVGVPGGLYLAAHNYWYTPFLILGGLCALVFIGILVAVPSFTGHLVRYKPQTFIGVMKSVLEDKNRRWALLLTLMIMPSHFFIIPFLTDYFTFNLGFDYSGTVPLVYIVGGAITAFSSPMIGKLSDRIGRYKVLLALSVLSLIPLIGIPNLQTDNKIVLLCFTASFFVFSGSRMIISMAHTTSTAEPSIRGAFLIINSSVQQFGTSMASLIGGFIVLQSSDHKLHNYPYLGYIAICFVLLAVLVFNKVKPLKV